MNKSHLLLVAMSYQSKTTLFNEHNKGWVYTLWTVWHIWPNLIIKIIKYCIVNIKRNVKEESAYRAYE